MIDSSHIERLRRIGLSPALLDQLNVEDSATEDGVWMRVTEVHRDHLALHDGEAEHVARQLAALRSALAEQGDALAVGDWVCATRNTFDEWWVHQRLQPLNQLARRLHDGRDKVERVVIVSNVDTALLVMGLDHDFNLRRLERYVALVRMAGVPAVVVLTKRDLCVEADQRLAAVAAMLPRDVPAVAVDAQGQEPVAALAPWLQAGLTLVLLGSSGAGKSTLTNALTQTDGQVVGANRQGDNRGRHTTSARSMHLAPGGACIIDTPGLRTLRLDGESGGLEAAFEDIAKLALECRFRDCQHADEPGCAVREGVTPERLRNYRKLLRESRRDTLTALERKSQVQQWKARGRASRQRVEEKREGRHEDKRR